MGKIGKSQVLENSFNDNSLESSVTFPRVVREVIYSWILIKICFQLVESWTSNLTNE